MAFAFTKNVSEVFNVVDDVRGILDPGDTITGTPTAVVTSGLTVGSVQTNTAIVMVGDVQVPIGKAILAVVSAGTANSEYLINFKFSTTNSATRYTSTITVTVEADPV